MSKCNAAAERVARNWRLFAGRAEWDDALGRWTVKQPTGALDAAYPLVTVTSETHATHSPVALSKHTTTTCGVINSFPEAYFIAAVTRHAIADLSAHADPLVAIHLTTFKDVQCIGITINHAIVDAHGFGAYLRAFNCELNGLPWTAPALETANKLDAAVARVAREATGDPNADPRSALLPTGMGYGSTVITWWRIKQLEWAEWIEESWFGVERATVFMGREVADRLIRGVKEDVKRITDGAEFVSTGEPQERLASYNAREADHSDLPSR